MRRILVVVVLLISFYAVVGKPEVNPRSGVTPRRYTVDLNDAPRDRFRQMARDFTKPLNDMQTFMKDKVLPPSYI
jgi:hypothetical protein